MNVEGSDSGQCLIMSRNILTGPENARRSVTQSIWSLVYRFEIRVS
jgi:hypothetical protein